MKASKLKNYVIELFDNTKIKVKGESGFVVNDLNNIKRIGYATNLTPETVDEAISKNVDIVITHHDAWDFVFGMKEYCIKKLEENAISHFFIHLPLDDCDFGTNVTFLEKLGAKILEKAYKEDEHFYCGRIAELEEPITFENLILKIEELLEEKIKSWKNNDKLIKRIGFVSGAGFSTKVMQEFVEKDCDVFITGEKVLYTIQYAEFKKINLLVGSHTYTEIFGVESLCKKIQDKFNDIEIVRLIEKHKE